MGAFSFMTIATGIVASSAARRRYLNTNPTVILDATGDSSVDLADAVRVLQYLFRDAPALAVGTDCVPVIKCPDVCNGSLQAYPGALGLQVTF